jgi:hypothetical protein
LSLIKQTISTFNHGLESHRQNAHDRAGLTVEASLPTIAKFPGRSNATRPLPSNSPSTIKRSVPLASILR